MRNRVENPAEISAKNLHEFHGTKASLPSKPPKIFPLFIWKGYMLLTKGDECTLIDKASACKDNEFDKLVLRSKSYADDVKNLTEEKEKLDEPKKLRKNLVEKYENRSFFAKIFAPKKEKINAMKEDIAKIDEKINETEGKIKHKKDAQLGLQIKIIYSAICLLIDGMEKEWGGAGYIEKLQMEIFP
jgi:tetrahydromethanopterin S-methyltransferase subunit G